MNTLDNACHLVMVSELTAYTILRITFKFKIQIFRHKPPAPNNFDSAGPEWGGRWYLCNTPP